MLKYTRHIDQCKLKLLLEYCPDGGFKWKTPNTNRVRAGDIAGSFKQNGYRHIQIDGVCHLEHRLVWVYHHGVLPMSDIDHINGVRDDNRIENLRAVTRHGNMLNSRKRTDNTSGIVGVYYDDRRNKWYSTICFNKRTKFLGYFDCKLAATIVRKCAERSYGFHKNHGRA